MVAARYADEGNDAVPADRMVLDPVSLMTIDDIKITSGNYSIPVGELYLRPDQRYRLTISDEAGRTIGATTIEVDKSASNASAQKALRSDPTGEPCNLDGLTLEGPCPDAPAQP
jgi:hypothetical protein